MVSWEIALGEKVPEEDLEEIWDTTAKSSINILGFNYCIPIFRWYLTPSKIAKYIPH